MAMLRFGMGMALVLITAAPVCGQWHDWQTHPAGEFRLASGRTFYAQVDRRTDENTLWLRFAWDRTIIRRPVAWARVVHVRWEGRTFTGPEFREWQLGPLGANPAALDPEVSNPPALDSTVPPVLQPAVPPAAQPPDLSLNSADGAVRQPLRSSLARAGRVAAATAIGKSADNDLSNW